MPEVVSPFSRACEQYLGYLYNTPTTHVRAGRHAYTYTHLSKTVHWAVVKLNPISYAVQSCEEKKMVCSSLLTGGEDGGDVAAPLGSSDGL